MSVRETPRPRSVGAEPRGRVVDDAPTTFADPDRGVPWPACRGRRVGVPTRRRGADAVDPCPWPATHVLGDTAGATALVCASHAAHPSVDRLTRVEPPDG